MIDGKTIRSVIKNSQKQTFDVIYRDVEDGFGNKKFNHVHAVCFYEDKLVIVKSRNGWTLPGGELEEGENVQSAIMREIKEETNMKVLKSKPIGYQDIFEKDKIVSQARFFCVVEPYSDFTDDPDGDISEIKLINPKTYKQYFDWGEIGDHIMNRVLQIKIGL